MQKKQPDTSQPSKDTGGRIPLFINAFKSIVQLVKHEYLPVIQTLTLFVLGIVVFIVVQYFDARMEILQNALHQDDGEHISIEKEIEKSGVINDILTNTMIDTGADRASIMQFHNSITSVAGTEFLYMSGTHEVTRHGISSGITRLQQIPIGVVLPLIRDLEETTTLCHNSDNIEEDGIQLLLRSQNTRQLCIHGIYHDGRLVGLLEVDYVTSELADGSLICDYLFADARQIEDILYRE